jgi:hypothetical protein
MWAYSIGIVHLWRAVDAEGKVLDRMCWPNPSATSTPR